MTREYVEDQEEIYRRVPPAVGRDACYTLAGGELRFHTSVFNDVAQEPSVDRAIRREFDPHRTRLNVQDGVVALSVGTVRQDVGPIQLFDKKQRITSSSAVDVVYAPIFGNCAHALIVASPAIPGNAFRRLKERLVRLANAAGWKVPPAATLPRRGRIELLREAVECTMQRLRELLFRY